MTGRIRVGIGGWTYEPWRRTFYPEKWPQARELDYAASKLTAIEVNGTYYGSQKPKTFAAWAKAVPDGFVFSLKASRYCTNRKILAEGGASIEKFLSQGLAELGDKLGPILWQFMPTKKFDADDFEGFLKLLPAELEGRPLRHALEVRHDTFRTAQFVDMARAAGAAVVFADGEGRPVIADLTADFAYARLMDAREEVETGYDATALDRWAETARGWAEGRPPEGMGLLSKAAARDAGDVFVFMINGAKVRAPAAARALISKLA